MMHHYATFYKYWIEKRWNDPAVEINDVSNLYLTVHYARVVRHLGIVVELVLVFSA